MAKAASGKVKVLEDGWLETADLLQLLHTARRKLALSDKPDERMKNMADTVQSIVALVFGNATCRLTSVQMEVVRTLEKELLG